MNVATVRPPSSLVVRSFARADKNKNNNKNNKNNNNLSWFQRVLSGLLRTTLCAFVCSFRTNPFGFVFVRANFECLCVSVHSCAYMQGEWCADKHMYYAPPDHKRRPSTQGGVARAVVFARCICHLSRGGRSWEARIDIGWYSARSLCGGYLWMEMGTACRPLSRSNLGKPFHSWILLSFIIPFFHSLFSLMSIRSSNSRLNSPFSFTKRHTNTLPFIHSSTIT